MDEATLPHDPATPQTSVTIRPMTDDDVLGALTGPDPFGWLLASWREADVAMPIMASWVAEVGGRAVGWAATIPFPVAAGGFGVAHGWIDPAFRRRGIGAALRARVLDALSGAVPGVQYSYDEGDPAAAAAAAAWDLEETGRHAESVLDLAALDGARLEALGEVDGVVFLPLDLSQDDDRWSALHAFAGERYLEAPDVDDDARIAPLAVFRQLVREPWSALIATRDGHPVGLTLVTRRADAEANTWFTGVAAAERGRGVATALKARLAVAMSAVGVERLYTQNMDGNAPILRANATLGFRPSFRYVDVRELLPG